MPRASLWRAAFILALISLIPASLEAANVVSSFSISGSVVGNSTDQATGNVSVSRDPGSNDQLAIAIGLPPGVGLICTTQQIGEGTTGCYLPANQNSMTVYLIGGYVTQDTTVNVSASNAGNPNDPGQTASLTILAPHSTVIVSPSSMIGSSTVAAAGTVTLDKPIRQSAVVVVNPTAGAPVSLFIPVGGQSATFTFTGFAVAQAEVITLTPNYVLPESWIDIWKPCKQAINYGTKYRTVTICCDDGCKSK